MKTRFTISGATAVMLAALSLTACSAPSSPEDAAKNAAVAVWDAQKDMSAEQSHQTVTALLCKDSFGIPGVAGGWGSIPIESYSITGVQKTETPTDAEGGSYFAVSVDLVATDGAHQSETVVRVDSEGTACVFSL